MRARAMCLALSDPIRLLSKLIDRKDILLMRALAMCLAPSSPI